MNWVKRDQRHLSSPYQILSGVRGWEAWVFSKTESGVIGREIKTLERAKQLCEEHKANGHVLDTV